MQNMLDTIVHYANAEDRPPATHSKFSISGRSEIAGGKFACRGKICKSPKRSIRYSSARMQRCRFAPRSRIRNSAKSSGLSRETDSYMPMPLESVGAAAALGSLRPRG
jgi:hypothetical protein